MTQSKVHIFKQIQPVEIYQQHAVTNEVTVE